MMQNSTDVANESKLTTALEQNINEAAITTELVKSFTKYVNDIHLYGFIIVIPLGIVLNSLSLIIFQKNEAFSTSIGNHLKMYLNI